MKLHPIQHDMTTRLWCGLAALSAVTGRPTSHACRAIQDVRGDWRSPVEGINVVTLVAAARRLGVKLTCVWNYQDEAKSLLAQSPTLAEFTREFSSLWRRVPAIVRLTGHYIMLEDGIFLDAHVPGPTPIRNAPGLGRRVKSVWRVSIG